MNTGKSTPATVPGITFVREHDGIYEYTLKSNGLQILLAPNESQSVAGIMVTYRVGSRNEAVGYTGATHLLEHLMFKGSEKFHVSKGNAIDFLLETSGALLNATTSYDRTNYFEILSTDMLTTAIEIEADRMRTATFTESDRRSEMPIVRSEFEYRENESFTVLDKEIWSAAFMAHPYHHPIIGWESDIENISIERLRQFYNEFYWPNNATVSIAGGIDQTKTLQLLKKFFGVHPKSPHPIPSMYTTEPLQRGQRRVTVTSTGVPMICVSHKIPGALHCDTAALAVLASVLYEDKTSRLYKTFIETAKATDVSAYANRLHDTSLFQTFVSVTPSMPHAKAEALLLKEYKSIIEKGITAKELSSAKQAARIYFSRRTDGPYALLSAINEEIAIGDWTQYTQLPEAIQKVTAKDVQRVAKTYLIDDQSTVGWFIAKK